ncbi:MAG: branched-chain amino acid ABC transporter permease [Chloroflexi bacterium]|nr:branched-chain amino acid ABC transporter permease [Chloroflexota bacterium]
MGQDLALLFIGGVTKGCMYALIAVGYQLVFVSTRVFNFSLGAVAILGGLILLSLRSDLGLPFPLALAIVFVAGLALGWFYFQVLLRPVRRRDLATQMLVIFGMGLIIENAYALIWGQQPLAAQTFLSKKLVLVLGMPIRVQSLWVIGLTVLSVVLLKLLLDRTWTGRALRANAQNETAARLMGVSLTSVGVTVYGMTLALAMVAGAAISPITYAGGYIAVPLLLKGFAGLIVGGAGSPFAAALGGLILGLVEAGGTKFLSPSYIDAIGMGFLLLFLLVRPQGLFAARTGQ